MSKVLILAESGFGKSTSIGRVTKEETKHLPKSFEIEGLNPEETYIISATSKPLPFKGSKSQYPLTPGGEPPTKGHRYITNDGFEVAKIIGYVSTNRPDIKNVVIDDSNYIMQDYYMRNSKKGGYDVFKNIGQFMSKIFDSMESASHINFFMLAHYENFKHSSGDDISYRFKTVGKMVQDYITPEGKFDLVLFGKQTFDEKEKEISKVFVTNFDGQYPSKSPIGMFENFYIPNDLGYVKKKIEEYYGE